MVAAGGTAGHVFPAEALVEALRRRGWRPVVFTDRRAIEHGFGGAERHVLAGAGIAGRGLWRGLAAFGAMAAGMRAARRRMVGLRPRVVVGFGGYPSVAPVLAARLMARRPRILLHEQNAVLGRANRVLALLADRLAVSFAGTLHAPRTAVVTGNPVRAEVQGVAYAPSGEGPFSILIFGGSLGARVMADLVPEALAGLAERTRLRVVQQCRAEDLKRVAEVYAKAGIRAELASFFADVPERLAASHLVIARAGASSIAELAVSGRPAILVPLPSAIDDHQRANAGALAAAGAAIVLDQVGLTAARMGAAIASLRADPARLAAMAEAAARFGRVDAAERLADLVEALGGGA
ncbi:MAG TPA: undecaprenyldiphospho-muramoylpentapeptide beta-N-acetylglucosaminyltransferase [Acetobacteraceae bacterium]|nr:undecaprenyldiphospho-muramoylpentapeptide beta-N-acetylglucosaminyltransferase [Acetobacteraceae bacterium]